MAERIVSPGVFTQENDLSFLPVGIGEIGAAIIGNTQKGVAFEPQVIRSFNEFQDQFGAGTDGTYVPYTVKEYIRHAGAVTIVRTLGLSGYSNSDSALIYTMLSGSGALVTQSAFIGAVLHPSARDEDATFSSDAVIGELAAGNIDFINGKVSHSFTNTEAQTNLTFSFDESNSDYILNCLGQDSARYVPSTTLDAADTPISALYVYALFNSESVAQHIDEKSFSNLTGAGTIQTTTMTASRMDLDFNGGTNSPIGASGYSHAATPWFRSQTVNGNTSRLFKVHTLGHGNAVNDDFKISISNIKKAGAVKGDDYGSFTLQVRKYDDTDTRPVAIETYANLSLDPDNANFLGRRVGTQYRSYDASGKLVVNGMYPNISKYVRLEVEEAVTNKVFSPKLVPFGHDAYYSPFTATVVCNNGAADTVTAAYPPAVLVVSKSHDDSKSFFGFEFNSDNAKGNYNYVAPLSDTAAAVHNKAFILDASALSGSGTYVDLDSPLKYKKFSVAFQGGFDGVNPALRVSSGKDLLAGNTFGHDISSTTSTGYTVYKKALDAISNPDEIDINLIVTPGILNSNSTSVIAKAIEICEDRGDCFYIFDPNNSLTGDSVSSATAQADSYDTNYAAMYYPWVKILDAATNRFKFVPPSVVIPGVYAFNDKVAHPWFAPAGLNRGSLTTVLDVYTRLTHAERDSLYEGRINPIAVFPRTGVCVWGQKTLQAKPSALDRINVRRLLIAAKKFIASATKYLVFENNTTATRQRFLNIVNPYLESVQQNQGLYAFRVIMDETNNTPDIIDRNIMKGEIFLQPAKAAEFIIIDFNIMPTGASFDE